MERTYADIGAYPEVGLKAARAKRDEVKAALRAGRDPVQARALARAVALPKASTPVGRPALLKLADLGDVLRPAELARLSPAVRMAHRLCAFAPGARISNIVAAEWSEFDLDAEAPAWTIPRGKMKARDRAHDHRIILGPAPTVRGQWAHDGRP